MLSCESINNVLKSELNPWLPGRDEGEKFEPGDKIINTKNSPVTGTNYRKTAIVNGDIGIINFCVSDVKRFICEGLVNVYVMVINFLVK